MPLGGKGVGGQAKSAPRQPEWLEYLSNPQKLAEEISRNEQLKAEAESALAEIAKGRDIEKLHADALSRADAAKKELERARASIAEGRIRFEEQMAAAREKLKAERQEFERWAAGERGVIKAERKATQALHDAAKDKADRATELLNKAEDDTRKAKADSDYWRAKRDKLIEALND